MNFLALFQNKALIVGLTAWALAQVIKIPLDYLRTRRWNWALLLTTGGMPSSHTALVVTADEWDRPYSRQRAAFPNAATRERKFWPAVSRVESAYGDRNLVCSCPPVEDYA